LKLSKAGHPSNRTALSLIRQDYEHCLRQAREQKDGPVHHFWINRRDHLAKILLILKHHKLGRH